MFVPARMTPSSKASCAGSLPAGNSPPLCGRSSLAVEQVTPLLLHPGHLVVHDRLREVSPGCRSRASTALVVSLPLDAVIELSPPSHGEASLQQGDTGRPGVLEEMLTAAGFRPRERGAVTVVNEWPDLDIAVRALAAAGPSVPAIQAVGLDVFCDGLREVIGPMHVPGVGIRISSELGWITADVDPR